MLYREAIGFIFFKFGFKELLELMARFSNNDASARCMTALSYQYIHASLINADFYSQATGGLWLAAPYPHQQGHDCSA